MIFVLGANGFLGSSITEYLDSINAKFKPITRDNYENFKNKKCDILINANGNSKKYLANEDRALDFELSVSSVSRSLNDFKFNKYIYLSSSDIYPVVKHTTTNEDEPLDILKQSNYGFHKYLAELLVKKYSQKWLIFRLGGFVGKNLKKNPIYDIINQKKLWLKKNSRLQIMNSLNMSKIIIDMSLSKKKNQIFNLSGKGTISINEIIKMHGKTHRFKYDKNSKFFTSEMNIEKILKLKKFSRYILNSKAEVKSFFDD